MGDSSEDEAAKAPQFRKSYSHNAEAGKSKEQTVKKKLISGVKGFFKFSRPKDDEVDSSLRSKPRAMKRLDETPSSPKAQSKSMNPINSGEKKLPKNFANKVLDYELKIDSGRFDIETIDKLMQLYSQAVEYYSGQNDEKYMYFTERI